MNHEISQKLTRFNQQHILEHLAVMTEAERRAFTDDAVRIDLEQLAALYETYTSSRNSKKEKKVFQEVDVLSFNHTEESLQHKKRLYALGEDCLRDGRVAVFLVAGGQGSRLGFQGPKGCFPITPVKGKSLFQLFAENINALSRRYGTHLHWYIMTSQENHEETCRFFRQNSFFNLPQKTIHCIMQKQIPSLDLEGRLIVSTDKKIFKNPNGHGGSLYALHDSGALQEMARQGIEEIFYFQVDNPLAKIADPLFIGAHVEQQAEMSTKVVKKVDPDERVGIIGRINSRLGCIEYSELSRAETRERGKDGELRFKSANIAIHMLKRNFVEKLTGQQDFNLPYHLAVKDIECLENTKADIKSKKIKGLKFEMFIFDALGFAERSVTLEVPREEEFSPVKNKDGVDSPETARRALINLHTHWLNNSGKLTSIPESFVVEVSPLFALDEEEFAQKFNPPSPLKTPLYVE